MRQAPGFTLADTDGKPVSLKDFVGSRVIVFFYPAAMTPGCTTQACDFRDSYTDFVDAGYQILGISPDEPDRNRMFKEKEGLPFPLLSDPKHKVAEAYEAWGTKKNYGREYEGLIRSTFVIDDDGAMLREMRNVRATGHVSRVRDALLSG